MNLSSDPLLEEVQQYIRKMEFGNPDSVGANLQPILSNQRIFGVDLYELGLGAKVEAFFKELMQCIINLINDGKIDFLVTLLSILKISQSSDWLFVCGTIQKKVKGT